jgi:hypothetical protein
MASNLASGSGTGSRRSRGVGSGSGSKRDGGRGSRGGRVGTRIDIVIIDYVLQEALNDQDNEHIERTNSFVLGVVGGVKDYLEDEAYGDEDGDDDDDMEDGEDADYEPSQTSSVRSEPAVTSKGPKSLVSKIGPIITLLSHQSTCSN